MGTGRIPRILPGAAVAALALAAAPFAGAPFWAALVGLVGGALAMLLASSPRPAEAPPEARTPSAAADTPDLAGEVIAALPDPVLLLSGRTVEAANPAAKALLGGWIEGRDAHLILRQPALAERISAPAAAGSLEVTGLGGAERPWLVAFHPLAGERQLLLFQDRGATQAAERMRVDFVANASHELRTPLATILGFIETLEDDSAGGDPELRGRFLKIMQGEGRRMQQVIEDLMSLSRIEAERFSPPTEPLELPPLVEEVREGCGQLLAEKRNRLVLENECGAARVAGDRGQLLQLIRNLVSNAVKYGREDSAVTVRIAPEGPAMLRLTVSDLGEGIAAEHLPRLTERFYRVDSGRSRAEGGTGLGLAIVKHIVGRHRGRLEIRSTPGQGTSVHVLLPRLATDDAGGALS